MIKAAKGRNSAFREVKSNEKPPFFHENCGPGLCFWTGFWGVCIHGLGQFPGSQDCFGHRSHAERHHHHNVLHLRSQSITTKLGRREFSAAFLFPRPSLHFPPPRIILIPEPNKDVLTYGKDPENQRNAPLLRETTAYTPPSIC